MARRKKEKDSFESRLAALEEVVEKLESGDLGLEEALALYEKGVQLLSNCHKTLNEAEKKMEILLETHTGKPKLQEVDPESFVE